MEVQRERYLCYVKAVDVPELRGMTGVLVFPSTGIIPTSIVSLACVVFLLLLLLLLLLFLCFLFLNICYYYLYLVVTKLVAEDCETSLPNKLGGGMN